VQGSTTDEAGRTLTGPVGHETVRTGGGPEEPGVSNPDDEETGAASEREARAAKEDRSAKSLEEQYGVDFEETPVADLREIAKDEEVELHGARSKDDIIKALRAHKGR
jgi:hypothetical protein